MIATTTPNPILSSPVSLEKVLLESSPLAACSSSSLMAQLAMNPRIFQALLELQAAESMLAESRNPQRTPWLMNSMLSQQLQRPTSPEAALLKKLQDVQANSHLITASPPAVAKPIACSPALMSSILAQELQRPISPHSVQHEFQHFQPSALPQKTSEVLHMMSPNIQTIVTASTGMHQYAGDISDIDILCGRGGKSNHHPGNKRYRQVVSQIKASYKSIGSKSAKTDLSRAIVEHVYQYGGRFLKQDKNKAGKFVILTPSEARKKTSQALRESKSVKWIMAQK